MTPKNKTAITSDAQQEEINSDFGISLLKALTLDQNNSTSSFVFSPISLLFVLSQLNLGAKNKTAEEIAKIFGQGKNFICSKRKKYSEAKFFLRSQAKTFRSAPGNVQNLAPTPIRIRASMLHSEPGAHSRVLQNPEWCGHNTNHDRKKDVHVHACLHAKGLHVHAINFDHVQCSLL